MKRILVIAALTAVAACSKPAPAPEATAEASAEPAASAATAAPLAADGKSSVGQFKVTTHDGKIVMEEVKADGTYIDTIDGKVVETGKWEQKSPAEYCFTKDEAGAKQKCNTEKVDDKGVWTSVDAEGKTATVVRVAG